MTPKLPTITGIGSVSPFGPVAGLIPLSTPELRPITAWNTDGLRRAFLVEPFQPASVVPGLKTRRLDRLSAWALVTASLALQDAGIDLSQMDRSRVAVVFATSFGCIELTEAFYRSAFKNGWAGTDPITFPETLVNSPAGHVALLHNLRGPNITVSSKNFAGESALLQAASLLRHGQADVAIVIAGDTLTQTMYEWYETANLLSPACFQADMEREVSSYVPGEGVVALVLEPAGERNARSYAHLHAGRWAAGGEPLTRITEMLDGSAPRLIIAAGDGAPCATSSSNAAIGNIVAPDAAILPAHPVALGLTDAGGLLHLALALSTRPDRGSALMLATAANSGFAALLLKLP
jgi:3-oxoacyl-[acyl-carrier-protein] synthase II